MAYAVGEGVAEERDHARPRDRLRQDGRAQPRADRRLGEIVALGRPVVFGVSRKSFLGKLTGREVDDRRRGHRRGERARARARGRRVPRPRRAGDARCPYRGRCYLGGPMARDEPEDYDDDDLTDDDDDEREGPEVGVTVEIVGPSLYTHHGVTAAEREIGQRLVLDVRFDVGEPDALVTDRVEDTVDYGEVCQVIARCVQDARAAVRGDRRPARVAVRRRERDGEGLTEPPIPLPVEDVGRGLRGGDRPPRWGRRAGLGGSGDRVLGDLVRLADGGRAPRVCLRCGTPTARGRCLDRRLGAVRACCSRRPALCTTDATSVLLLRPCWATLQVVLVAFAAWAVLGERLSGGSSRVPVVFSARC